MTGFWLFLSGATFTVAIQRAVFLTEKRLELQEAEAQLAILRNRADEAARTLYETRARLIGQTFECPICGLPRDLDDGIYEDSVGHQACDEADQ